MDDAQRQALERLRAVAARRAWPGDDAALAALVAWTQAVLDRSQQINLTGARDLPAAIEALAVTALAVGEAWGREPAPGLVADLGSGNGLPGVAAALAWPTARVLLVERRQRKAAAIADLLRSTPMAPRVEVLALDAREVVARRPEVAGGVDLVTARAVADLETAVVLAGGWLAPGGRLAHWKGASLDAKEREAGRRAAARLGLVERDVVAFDDDAGPARLVVHQRP